MENLEHFKEQIKIASSVTEEAINKFNNKIYHSGRKICIGDNILYALLETLNDGENRTLTIITLHQEKLGNIYEPIGFVHEDNCTFFPIVKHIKDAVIITTE